MGMEKYSYVHISDIVLSMITAVNVLGREHGRGLDGTFPTVSLSGRVMPTGTGRRGT